MRLLIAIEHPAERCGYTDSLVPPTHSLVPNAVPKPFRELHFIFEAQLEDMNAVIQNCKWFTTCFH